MKTYEVVVRLQSQTFTVVAEDEEAAIGIAYETATSNSPEDLVKWADYEVEEVSSAP